MKAFEKWYESVGIELIDSCLFRLPKELAEKTWKAALQWVLSKEYITPESPTIKNPNGHNVIDSIVIEEELKD